MTMRYINKYILSKAYPLTLKTRRGKPFSCYIQRVESLLYYDLGLDKLHYQHGEISRGSMGLLITSRRRKPLAFIVLRNQTFKGCSNAMMVSRYVILPAFQRRGLSVEILNEVGAMLKARGMRMYINTHLETFGEALGRSGTFKSTTTDRVNRCNTKDGKFRKRQGGVAYRKMYDAAEAEVCYNELFMPVNVLREKHNKPIEAEEKTHTKRYDIAERLDCIFTAATQLLIASHLHQQYSMLVYDVIQRVKIPDRYGGEVCRMGKYYPN